jgi:hypothetical protein
MGSAVLTFDGTKIAESHFAANCIFWGNLPSDLTDDPKIPPPISVELYHCITTDAWTGPGSNNFDADPLFIQPGCNDFRLGHGSPAIDAGDNSLLPPGIGTDIDGQQRILNGIVDLGAYEGGHDLLPLAACFDDLDVGEFIRLIPMGGLHDPVTKPSIGVRNLTGTTDEWVSATQFDEPPPPALDGTAELSSIVRLETSLLDGQHFSTPTISFEAADLNGVDPTTVDLVYYHAQSHRWRRAALGNAVNSPGHGSPLGDRIVMVGTDANYGLGQGIDLGDHGVFWNPELQRGFVWARVDFAGDFAVAVVPLCIADCASPANLMVDIADLMLVINTWQATGPGLAADLNHDEIVDMLDILLVVAGWGRCP